MKMKVPFQIVVLTFLEIIDKVANSSFFSGFHDVACAFGFFSGDSISEFFGWERVIDYSVVCLNGLDFTMVTPCCSLKDFLYFLMCSGVWISRSAGCRHICADTPNVSFLSPA